MAGKILSNAAKEIGIQYNVASHTMRKTFSYWFMQNNKEDMAYALAKLQHILNHGSSATTLKYIGMTDDENKKYYENNTLGMY
jgi:integrase